MSEHPFYKTLGPGPYRWVGFFDLGQVLSALHAGNVNGYNNGLAMAPKDVGIGSCAHCGHGILNNYIVQTGTGERFAVGSECIEKCGNSGQFENFSAVERKIKLEKRVKAQTQRETRRVKQATEIKSLIDQNSEVLKTKPHPSPYHPSKTLYDYCLYCFRNGHISLGGIKQLRDRLNLELGNQVASGDGK